MYRHEKFGGEGGADDPAPYDAEKRSDEAAVLSAQLVAEDKYGNTRRGLKSRHVQLIALGGCLCLPWCLPCDRDSTSI